MHEAQMLADEIDPLGVLHSIKLYPHYSNSLYMGADATRLLWCASETSLLAVAVPRSAGKTVSLVVPNVLAAPGCCVVPTTKRDVFDATAMMRTRFGKALVFSPDGEETPPGAQQLRWSPLQGAKEWDVAVKVAKQLTETIAQGDKGHGDNEIWHKLAATYLAPMIYLGAHKGKAMRWVKHLVAAADVRNELLDVLMQLKELDTPDAEDAWRNFHGILSSDPRPRSSILATAAAALEAYDTKAALAAADDPNFDPDEFVRSKDTVYITAHDQSLFAPIIVAFLGAIRDAASRLHREDIRNGVVDRPPVTFVMDELGTMAPDPKLPQHLARGGENVLNLGVLHSRAQAIERWGNAGGDGLLSLFQNKIVFPGLFDLDFLEMLSKLSGQYEHELWSLGEGKDRHNHPEWQRAQHIDLRPNFTVDEIFKGHEGNSNLAFFIPHGGEMGFRFITPYFSSTPWPELIVKEMQNLVSRPDPERMQLPIPELNRDGTGNFLRRLSEKFDYLSTYVIASEEIKRWR